MTALPQVQTALFSQVEGGIVAGRLKVLPEGVGFSDEGLTVEGVLVFGDADGAKGVPGEAGR